MTRRQSYNLFRRSHEPELVCAVPEDRPVPPFLASPGWVYGGTVGSDGPLTRQIDERLLQEAVHLNGFYLLHRLQDGSRG